MDRSIKLTAILILFSLSLSAQLKSGLVGYWKFENNALDVTQNDNDGTVNGATYTASGKVGGAYDFDAIDDYVVTDNNIGITGSQNRTISIWIKVNDVSGNRTFVQWGTYGNTGEEFLFRGENSNAIRVGIWGGNRLWNYNFDNDTWHHYVLVLDGTSTSDLSLYIDGILQTPSSTSVITINTTDTELYIGCRLNGIPEVQDHLGGLIDELMIYRRALLATEVRAIYNSGNGVYFVMENFKKDKDYEKLNDYMLSRMYFGWINSAA